MLDDLWPSDDEMELQCPVVSCTVRVDGSRYRTEQLDQAGALRLLDMHVQYNHPQPQINQLTPRQQDVGGRFKTEKVPRPTFARGISEDKYIHFHRLWLRYKRSTQMDNEEMIRDQLLSCCTDELSEELGNLYG